jgi:hypothetical protein
VVDLVIVLGDGEGEYPETESGYVRFICREKDVRFLKFGETKEGRHGRKGPYYMWGRRGNYLTLIALHSVDCSAGLLQEKIATELGQDSYHKEVMERIGETAIPVFKPLARIVSYWPIRLGLTTTSIPGRQEIDMLCQILDQPYKCILRLTVSICTTSSTLSLPYTSRPGR